MNRYPALGPTEPDGYVKHVFYPGWYFAANPDPLAQKWAKNGSNCAVCGLTEPACAALNHVRPNCATIKGYRQETADAR